MDLLEEYLLIFIVFLPLAAAMLIALLPGDEKSLLRWLALIFSLGTFLLILVAWFNYDYRVADAGMQFEIQREWFPQIGSSFHFGADGISLPMLLLTGILTPLAILASFRIDDKTKPYMILFLLLETAMLGLFVSLDLIIFFIFWEFSLVPMYFLIRYWGGKDRRYASFKFMIYTMAGSLGLLVAIQVIGLSMGTFDIPELYLKWVNFSGDTLPGTSLSTSLFKNIAFWTFVIAFAIKIPVWPFHTWLPDAHTEAPTAGSMILAGVLLKMGAYGFIRLTIPLFPEQAHTTAIVLAIAGTLSIIMGGYAAFGQWDFKRLVAYSSINHMGFVVLGIAIMAWVYGSQVASGKLVEDAIMGTSGAVMQMFNHGLSSAGMFFLVGVIYERSHTRQLREYGGLWTVLPFFAGALIFTSMASLGLPGLNGFVGEFMITRSVWNTFTIPITLSMLGLLLTGAYILKGIGFTLHGDLNPQLKGLKDMNLREHLVIWPLMLLMLSLGIWPQWLLVVINATVSRLFYIVT